MSIHELERTQEKVRILEKESARMLAKADSEIQRATDAGVSAEKLHDLSERRDKTAGVYADMLKAAGLARDEAQAREQARQTSLLAEQTANSAEAERRQKNQARQAWIRAGGDPGNFEEAWPRMWARQLEESALSKPNRPGIKF